MDNSSSLNNFFELSGFDSNLAFALSLMSNYSWDENTRDALWGAWAQIKEKRDDKKLNISVIGEFSTGKSSFINALLRTNLLASSIIQGTTTVCSELEYGNDYSITVTFKDGQTTVSRFSSSDDFKTSLIRLSTESDVNPNLSFIKATSPEFLILSDSRLIDTPGTNSIESWHEQATKDSIRNRSDLSIILIDATSILGDTFSTFISDNLIEVLPQCIFVVTKIDLVKEKERFIVLKYIKTLLESRYSLKNPTILPYVAPEVLASFSHNEYSKGDKSMYDLSLESEQQILIHANKVKALSQLKKLGSLISRLYVDLGTSLSGLASKHYYDLDLLERSRQAELTPFIKASKEKYISRLEDENSYLRSKYQTDCQKIIDKTIHDIMALVDNCNSLSDIKSFVNLKIKDICQKKAIEISKKFNPIKKTKLLSVYQEQLEAFQKDFEGIFSRFNILPVTIKPSARANAIQQSGNISNAYSVTSYVDEMVNKENYSFLGAAAAGAAVGTAICPGLGTIIGGIVGFFGGGYFAPSINEVKYSTKLRLQEPLQHHFSKLSSQLLNDYDTFYLSTKNCLIEEIEHYKKEYSTTVNSIIKKEQRQRTEIEGKIKAIEHDLTEIQLRQKQLDSIRTHLENYGEQ